MKKIIFLFLLLLPFVGHAQNQAPGDEMIKAKVVEIVEQRQNELPDGTVVEQQNLKLEIIEGELQGEYVNFDGIGSFDVIKKNIYKIGEKVLLVGSTDDQGNTTYFIVDYIREAGLNWLLFFFCVFLVLVSGFKGIRAIVSLVVSFIVIIKFIIPQILAGSNPFLITMIGSFFILLAIIYITEGFKARSHITVVSILISLVITIVISYLFVSLAKLSGLASEETMFLISLGGAEINFQGLLLAGIIIGALGVLDDVVISQVSTVEQIIKANPVQTKKQIFISSYEVGVSHISSMTNTLFLAYAGASLPLLVLFISGESAFSSWNQIINNEAIATEIVRTLTGSIGLISAVPISTVIAIWWFTRTKD